RGQAAAAPPSRAMNSRRLTSDTGLPPYCPGITTNMRHAQAATARKVLAAELNRFESRLRGSNSNPPNVLCCGIKPGLPAKRKAPEATPDAAVKFLKRLQTPVVIDRHRAGC